MGPTKEEIAEADKLVRWRANPKKIRVSIRKLNPTDWQATVTCIKNNERIISIDTDPFIAVMGALEQADYRCWSGVDLGMDWIYTHPWR